MPWTTQEFRDGYLFVETSAAWKKHCEVLPCNKEIYWPGYATTVIDTTINGHDAVIQLWKGRCEKLARLPDSPGGIGAEVGIYRRVSTVEATTKSASPVHFARNRPPSMVSLINKGSKILYGSVENARNPHAAPVTNDIFYPYPELGTKLWFRLTNAQTGEEFFHTPFTETTYWLTRWMTPDSYDRYKLLHAFPPNPASYILHYTINGQYQLSW